MADHFRGVETIYIQPGDTSVPYSFQLTIATASTKNDGALPYGSSLHKFTASVHQANNSSVGTSDIIVSSSVNINRMDVKLGYSTSLNSGLHHLEFIVTGSINGSTASVFKKEFDFNRLWVKDK